MAGLPAFSRTDSEIRQHFGSLDTRDDLADLLQVPLSFLTLVLYKLRPEGFYNTFQIRKKSGGVRKISAPTSSLYILQHRVNQVLRAVYVPRPCVHGFLNGRSTVSNAQAHVGRRTVLNVDLEDFFPSINFGRVRGVLLARPFLCGEQAATSLAQIVCLDNGLPAGGPASPLIANMVSMKLDGELMRLAAEFGAWYTRYADDLTFSSDAPTFPVDLASLSGRGTVQVGDKLEATIQQNGFEINHEKTRMQNQHMRQTVTGVVVNERLNVDRRYIRRIRAMIHSLDNDGLPGAQRKLLEVYKKDRYPEASPEFLDVLRGRIAYLSMVRGSDDAVVRRFTTQVDNILAGRDRNDGIPEETGAMSAQGSHRTFISYVHEDSKRVDSLESDLKAAGIPVWRDVNDLWPGQDWKTEIRKAIQEGSFAFVACISESSLSKYRSGMFEELAFAAEEHRKRNPTVPWIFPVLLDDVAVPAIDLGGGKTLDQIQWAPLHKDWRREMARLTTSLQKLIR